VFSPYWRKKVPKRLWSVVERGFHPDRQLHHETIFTIGNGYLGTRGSFEEGFAGDSPSTMVHGIFNHAPGMLVPELVNAPNWLTIRITVDGTPFQVITKSSDYMRPPEGLILGFERALELDRGVLSREVLFRAASGSIVRIVFERFASLHNQHILAQRVRVIAVEGSPTIELESVLDGNVTNNGVTHWGDMTVHIDGDVVGLDAKTQQSGYTLGIASKFVCPHPMAVPDAEDNRPAVRTVAQLAPEAEAVFDKLTAIYTSRDVSAPLESAVSALEAAAHAGYDRLYADHAAEWRKYWDSTDIQIEGDDECQLAVRFTTYHILITAPRYDENASIGAKTLSGMGYKGHIFWDTELFALPPLTLTQPKLARNLLMYRYHRLEGARHKAQANGYEGAMFPWESTDTGEETTPQWSDVQPDGSRIRIWTGDNEQHISTDIAYGVWQYWQWTGDDEFFARHGAELILDTAVFWGSRVEHVNGRYELSQQIGPDEYHENIDNSVFTNRMVVWHMQTALKALDWLRANAPADHDRLIAQLKLTPERQAKWADIIDRMYIPFDEEMQIHIQFPGFFEMEFIPVPHYTPRTSSVQAILGHARSIQTQVIKQADVVMMMALLGDAVGSREVMINNWNTYYPRTDHGSSLSPAMHAWVGARIGLMDDAYDMFYHAAHIDLHDNKGNVRDGMHAAACGGVYQALLFGFCGLQLTDDGPKVVNPRLPDHWKRVTFNVSYRGKLHNFVVENPA
jgi:trehalose/maltose hydrolase-like predicted phosphorylase